MKVSELSGALLDRWVALALGHTVDSDGDLMDVRVAGGAPTPFHPSTDWADGGPLIDQFNMYVNGAGGPGFEAHCGDRLHYAQGLTALVAICRAVVLATYGEHLPEDIDLNGIAPLKKQA